MPQQPNRRRTETLDYMQSMLGQLRTMAEAERCDMLAYLIEMAYVEASDIIRGERPLRIKGEQRDSAAGVAFEPPGKVKFQ
ncbi:MAG: hypothetical protein IH590_15170 [Aquamicrobium sp.]|nr:hypothetical protein [Aquamicrobium sp.]